MTLVSADTPQPCSSTTWSPSSWTSLNVWWPNSTHAITDQSFYWTQSRLNAFKNLSPPSPMFQYEVRRPTQEYWDYVRKSGWFTCIGSKYYTNLPSATTRWSEESDSFMWECFIQPQNEEFQVNAQSSDLLKPNYWYRVQPQFYRDPEDKGKSLHLHSESEWCRTLLYGICKGPGPSDFGWCTMTSKNTTA